MRLQYFGAAAPHMRTDDEDDVPARSLRRGAVRAGATLGLILALVVLVLAWF